MSDQQTEKEFVEELFQGMKARKITGIILIDTPDSSFSIVNGRDVRLQQMLVRTMRKSPELARIITGAMCDFSLTKNKIMKTEVQLDKYMLEAIQDMQTDNKAENLAEDLTIVVEQLSDESADIKPINRVEYINMIMQARRFILTFRKDREDSL